MRRPSLDGKELAVLRKMTERLNPMGMLQELRLVTDVLTERYPEWGPLADIIAEAHLACGAAEVIETDDRGNRYTKLGEARYYFGCPQCMRNKRANSTFFPPHHASASCESGGHNHCTCDTCF